MDCFYAAVHMRDDPTLQGKPVVIGGNPEGRGVVAAASYEARRFGIRSAMPAARARRLSSEVIFIRPDFARYRAESTTIFEIFRRFTPLIQTVALDEAYLDVTDHLGDLPTATALAKKIRHQVAEETGLTVSIGVGPNRLVAKIASDFDKPDGLTVVPPPKVQRFLDPLPVRSLLGVGPATDRSLAEMEIRTIAELRQRSEEELTQRFGKYGSVLYRFARGIDERPVRTSRERKSLGQERTYAKDLSALDEMDGELDRLSLKVAAGLARRELVARTVTVKIRYPDFTTLTRAETLNRPTADAAEIGRAARRLLRKTEAEKRRVRLLGVTASKLIEEGDEPSGTQQLPLFGESAEPT